MSLIIPFSQPAAETSCLRFGAAGRTGTRLLAGPPAHLGAESLLEHSRRIGLCGHPSSPETALAVAGASGLLGRGGSEFPFTEKLRATLSAGGLPLVVVNGAEGEPASRKDQALLALRPHLVLDGASWAAAAVGAREAVVYAEPKRHRSWDAVVRAIWERRHAGISDPQFRLLPAPGRFVAGESSAVVAVLEGRGPLPQRRSVPVASCGPGGRPAVVSNTETFAHLGLIGRFGPEYFREAGSLGVPGSTLVTLAGGATTAGLVVEIVDPVRLGYLLEGLGGLDALPEAVLLGGYSGRWVSGGAIWETPADRAALKQAGCGLGCGVIAPLRHGACGLEVTRGLLGYLARESTGQCGSCTFGLPTLVEALSDILTGRSGRRAPRRLLRMSMELEGRGGCGHPDGAIGLLQSCLHVFAGDADRHARGRPCGRHGDGGWFPVPAFCRGDE